MDEFTKSVLGDVTQDNNNNDNNEIQINDHELLSMISRHAKHTRMVPYGREPPASQVNVDFDQLSRVKKLIESSFILINEDSGHDYDGLFIAMGYDGISSFSLETLEWTPIVDTVEKLPYNTYQSSVVVRGTDIYSFGGLDDPNVYTRYSLAEKKVYQSDIVGANGGVFISVCHDGDSYIYLTGGVDIPKGEDVTPKIYFVCVDRFNIDTAQFEHVDQFFTGMYSYTFFHKDLLYIVNGSEISTYNVETGEVLKVSPDEDPNQAICCFDGIDSVYIKTSLLLTLNSISTNRRIPLKVCPIHEALGAFVSDDTGGLIHFGGKGKNYRYSIQDDTWTLLNDNDNSETRLMYV
ncbi:hypothetical protein SAMD00019534_085960 [Acytostelium subglobosum LB1]|uniref:hypothetical protein n=1 Tax=Acytostelium subglobosum LB1 TaxID=1410327 RepID=UPI000644C93D|nr:hypothetical protein SAMD00019534_085960 [Acytostelium subglobosum LB1]GAM25421.1 hypothetical protein SAMD00019534_085960 [Acytostelium subglobosum LB1]|eukprot:XP_012751407.1 hypothetical protein SAMD00019534_085960 [Acytostelium subglobosum LB1]